MATQTAAAVGSSSKGEGQSRSQNRPSLSPSISSSSEEDTNRPKRAQVKNACIHCQRACKKCDPGRPCQRCVKHNLADSCVDSMRKPRVRGIKRGPYKKRKKDGETSAASATSTTARADERRSRRRVRGASLMVDNRPPPRILGPGAIPILHTDPPAHDSLSDGATSSDTPLFRQQQQPMRMPPMAFQTRGPPPPPVHTHHYQHPLPPPHHHYAQAPETPTAGLTAAFNSLGTEHTHGASRYTRRPTAPLHRPNPVHDAPIRLPPIQSFDQAPMPRITTPPRSSSWLNVLTDAALDDSRRRPQPVLPPPPPHSRRPQSPSDVQQSSSPHLRPPEDSRSRHSYTTSESDAPSSVDSRQESTPDAFTRARVQKLSRRLHHTHIDHEMTPEL
ncbi:hypothetical protein GGI16_005646 [Coemansia sp. S142-1]|nr:hypothetical protein GGI16_005646 [Coemansia sp. S142-1]